MVVDYAQERSPFKYILKGFVHIISFLEQKKILIH